MQRSIEILIGRLVTDEDFRREFLRDPSVTLKNACESGLALSEFEIKAVLAIDYTLWDRLADQVDERLQKASLKSM